MMMRTSRLLAGIYIDSYKLDRTLLTAPIVFFIHGRGGNRTSGKVYCRDLAERGYIAIAVDQRNHGDRCVDTYQCDSNSLQYMNRSYGILTGTAMDISHLIDFLPLEGMTTSRIAVTGFSLGGHVCFASLVLDPRIKVAIPICGAGDRLMQLGLRSSNFEEFQSEVPSALVGLFQKYDAIHHLDLLADRKILMIHGADDLVVSPVVNQNLYEKLIKIHQNPTDLKISLHPKVGHKITPAMWQEAVEWIDEKL